MNALFLCLGGNMGNRAALLKQALALIASEIGTIDCQSSVYETEAWGHTSELGYYNLVVKVNTQLTVADAMQACLSIESRLGRNRDGTGYADRTMDIDIIFYNDLVQEDTAIILPHPRFHLRKFVLVPLHEIAATWIDPVSKMSVEQLLEKCVDVSTIRKIGSLT